MQRTPRRPAIELANDTSPERATRDLLLEVLDRYDLDRWFYTDRVRIESRVIPHSHPVLTLNTQYGGDQHFQLVATYIHEQLHWYWLLADRQDRVLAAMDRFEAAYPDLPVERPEGCGNAFSTYLHVPINTLELLALKDLIGNTAAEALALAWPYYRAIYALAVREYEAIIAVLDDLDLMPPAAPPNNPEFYVPVRFRTAD